MFDTSDLPDGAVVASGTIQLYVNSTLNGDNDGEDFLSIVQTTQATDNSIITADYDQCGSISNPTEGVDVGERKDIGAISTSAYLPFNLNSTGISWINKTGYTKLGVREGHDILNSTYAGGTNTYNAVNVNMASSAANKPQLIINYTAEQGGFLSTNRGYW